jgi:hypothetical protein
MKELAKCKICGTEFKQRRITQECCSKSCAQILKWQRCDKEKISEKIKESLNADGVQERKVARLLKTIDNIEYRKMLSENAKEHQNKTDIKERKSTFQKEYQNRLDIKEKKSAFHKEYQNRPDVKERTSEFQKEYQNRPDVKEATSKRNKNKWLDESYRNNMISVLQSGRTDESEQRRIESLKKTVTTDDYSKRMSVIQKEIHNRPDIKEKIAVSNSKRWQDPEYAANRVSRMYKYKEYEMPSGKIVKLQGYEPQVLAELLKVYSEDDIVTGIKEMNENLGRISYTYENISRTYYPDFYIKSTNTIIEVKSSYTYKMHESQNNAKKDACIQLGYNFEFKIYK